MSSLPPSKGQERLQSVTGLPNHVSISSSHTCTIGGSESKTEKKYVAHTNDYTYSGKQFNTERRRLKVKRIWVALDPLWIKMKPP